MSADCTVRAAASCTLWTLGFFFPPTLHGQLDLKFQGTDFQPIAVFQILLADNFLAVDEGAVLAAEVADRRPIPLPSRWRSGGG